MNARFESARILKKQLAQFLRNRLRKRDVPHNAATEKRVLEIALGAVEELVRQNDVAGPVFFLE